MKSYGLLHRVVEERHPSGIVADCLNIESSPRGKDWKGKDTQ